jgi:predicted peptidase
MMVTFSKVFSLLFCFGCGMGRHIVKSFSSHPPTPARGRGSKACNHKKEQGHDVVLKNRTWRKVIDAETEACIAQDSTTYNSPSRKVSSNNDATPVYHSTQLPRFNQTGRRSLLSAVSTRTSLAIMTNTFLCVGKSDAAAITKRIDITDPMSMRHETLNLPNCGTMVEITDAQSSLSGLLYDPMMSSTVAATSLASSNTKLPLLVVLHGAGTNKLSTAWNLASPIGEHAGLPPSLLASNKAPTALSDNFFVAAPYSYGKSSLYEEPRSKILQFVKFVLDSNPRIDRNRIFLLGFSDGATLAVELMTTGYFKGGIIAAYGFTGTLPSLAIERLTGIPLWVFHSQDDVIYSIKYSDRLVQTLKQANNKEQQNPPMIKYTRYEQDPEGFTGAVKGHSTGIAASKLSEVYQWLLSIN